MRIGPFETSNAVFAAPMAGVTDRPFRMLAKQLGAGYAVSEMAASNPQLWNTVKSSRRLNHDGEIDPVAVQIAGADPEMMASVILVDRSNPLKSPEPERLMFDLVAVPLAVMLPEPEITAMSSVHARSKLISPEPEIMTSILGSRKVVVPSMVPDPESLSASICFTGTLNLMRFPQLGLS